MKFSFTSVFVIVPVSFVAVGIIMVLVSRFDESLKVTGVLYPSAQEQQELNEQKMNNVDRISQIWRADSQSQSHNVLPRAVLSKLYDVF